MATNTDLLHVGAQPRARRVSSFVSHFFRRPSTFAKAGEYLRDMLVTGCHRARTKLESLRAERGSHGFSAAHSPGGFHGRQVLTQQARLLPSSPNVFEPEGLSCHQ